MTRRLVEIDSRSFRSKEVDLMRLKREALELKDYLLRLQPEVDTIGLRGLVMPICETALAGTLALPLDPHQKPVLTTRVEDMGGKIPKGFEELYARFINTATGSRAEIETPIHKDGKVWAWMEFEE